MDDLEVLKKWRRNIPDMFHGKFRKQWDKAISKKSMRAALNAKCADACAGRTRRLSGVILSLVLCGSTGHYRTRTLRVGQKLSGDMCQKSPEPP